ncbi:MAG: FHA domain-containing protein [Acidimicrobiales bacterium]|nr:FHA domain-containing protein [Acidimicrobiales bacterium]
MGYFIRIAEPGDEPRTLQISGSVEIGRQVSGIRVFDPAVSRRHLRLDETDQGVVLSDLGSSYGTFVNGRRALHPVVLRVGDSVQLGNTMVTLVGHVPVHSGEANSVGLQQPVSVNSGAVEPVGHTPSPPVPGTSIAGVVTPPPPIDAGAVHPPTRRPTPRPVESALAFPLVPEGQFDDKPESSTDAGVTDGMFAQAVALLGARSRDVALLVVLTIPGLTGLAALPYGIRMFVDDAVVAAGLRSAQWPLVAVVAASIAVIVGLVGTAWATEILERHITNDLLSSAFGEGGNGVVLAAARSGSGIASLCRESIVGFSAALVGVGVAVVLHPQLGFLVLIVTVAMVPAAWLGDRVDRSEAKGSPVAGAGFAAAFCASVTLLGTLAVALVGAWMVTDRGLGLGTLLAELILVLLVSVPVGGLASSGRRRADIAAALMQVQVAAPR